MAKVSKGNKRERENLEKLVNTPTISISAIIEIDDTGYASLNEAQMSLVQILDTLKTNLITKEAKNLHKQSPDIKYAGRIIGKSFIKIGD